MSCPSCASARQAEFTAEINIHYGGPRNVDEAGLLVFPQLLVCLDCGFSRFGMAGAELKQLVGKERTSETPLRRRTLSRPNSAEPSWS